MSRSRSAARKLRNHEPEFVSILQPALVLRPVAPSLGLPWRETIRTNERESAHLAASGGGCPEGGQATRAVRKPSLTGAFVRTSNTGKQSLAIR